MFEPLYTSGCFDYFRYFLSTGEKVYTPQGKEVTRVELANEKFGIVIKNYDSGFYCRKVDTKSE